MRINNPAIYPLSLYFRIKYFQIDPLSYFRLSIIIFMSAIQYKTDVQEQIKLLVFLHHDNVSQNIGLQNIHLISFFVKF